jgi:HAE1 family hydrophobic/amphiphilic exporter-1
MVEKQKQVAAIMGKDPNVQTVMSSIGMRGASNQGIVFATLKPRAERSKSPDELIQSLRPQLSTVPGMRVFLQNPPPIRIGGSLTKSQYQFTLQGADTKELYKSAPLLEAKMRELPGLQDVTSDLLLKNPQVRVEIDRDRAAALGVTPERIEDALYTAYGSRPDLDDLRAEQPVSGHHGARARVPDGSLGSLAAVSEVAVGDLVPLAGLAKFAQSTGPLSVAHLGQLPAVTISFNLRPRNFALGGGHRGRRESRERRCRRRSQRASRGRRRPFRLRRAVSACCSSWRCS